MTKRQQGQYHTLVRVDTFVRAHMELFPEGSEGRKALEVISTALARIGTFDRNKGPAKRQSLKGKGTAKQALWAQLNIIARSARVLEKSRPGTDAKFPLPMRKSDIAILQTGRLFLEGSEPLKEALIHCGLPATFVEDLRHAVDNFEGAIGGWQAGKTGAYVSVKGIPEELRKAFDAVRSLDVLVPNVLGHDVHTMNAWKRDRRVEFPTWTSKVEALSPTVDAASAVPMADDPLRRAS